VQLFRPVSFATLYRQNPLTQIFVVAPELTITVNMLKLITH